MGLMPTLFANERGGDTVFVTGDYGTGQVMVTIRSITASTASLISRRNWNIGSPSWSSPVIVATRCYPALPAITGPFASGRIAAFYVTDSPSALAAVFSDNAGGTWYA